MKPTTSLVKGLVISLLLIAISIVMYFMNIVSGGAQWGGFAIYAVGVIWSVWYYGKQINHNSGFGGYFGHGFKTAAVVTLMMVVYIVVFMMLFPDFKEKGLEAARKSMEANKNMSDDQIEKGMQFMTKGFTLLVVGGTLLWNLIIGCIAALIGAAITKKNPTTFQEEHFNQPG